MKKAKVIGLERAYEGTLRVEIEWVGKHEKYEKIIRKRKKLLVHDGTFGAKRKIGDILLIKQIKPVSKKKTWGVIDGSKGN